MLRRYFYFYKNNKTENIFRELVKKYWLQLCSGKNTILHKI